ncbi:sperm flagellar protein 1 isoform X2 [Bos javanicus]|uniref:sperm flagellar protein 1 isoform X2 n=1 Tax=Bos taurus TaxID=9913 RepID=UPI000760284A|nr:sperm flagellar protein 1 isoform X2 [Bos taurus]XP_061292639.1 sperm flagellar protein 1 isoform X2 [Bos javanicus]
MAGSVDEEALHQLYLWVDNIPLSRPKRNLSRDFSDGVLVAEVIKFYFPKMVEMHNYVPANSLQQKLSNWSHLNRNQSTIPVSTPRKVLNKLNFSVPEDVMRKIAQCAPGVVELVLIPLRQRLEERQRRRKQGIGSLQELAPQDGTDYMDVGLSQKARGEGVPDPQGRGQLREGRLPVPRPPGDSQALQSDPSFILQIAEKEQELLASQETVQVLQMKVRRLEHLLQLKNVRIEDLSRRLQQAEREWTAFQNPEATCRDLACIPNQCLTPGTLPWCSQCWALAGGPPAWSTPLEPGPHPALVTAVSPSRLVLCTMGQRGGCPRQLRGFLARPGHSPGTQLKTGEHSS